MVCVTKVIIVYKMIQELEKVIDEYKEELHE